MPNSDTIPSGSPITEDMVTGYMAIYGGTRSAAIGAMTRIANGSVAPSTAQRTSALFSPLVSSYDQSVGAFGEGGRIISPTDSNDVMTAGPNGTGKYVTFATLLTALGTIATLAVTSLTATTGAFTNLTATTFAASSVDSASLPNTVFMAMTNATTTPCAIQNTASSTRILWAIGLTMNTSTAVGELILTIGTSSNPGVTSTSPLFAGVLNRAATGNNLITTTSTLQTVYGSWHSQDWLVWKDVSSTNVGTCYALYK